MFVLALLLLFLPSVHAHEEESPSEPRLGISTERNIQEDGLGNGFGGNVQSVAVNAGLIHGLSFLGDLERHKIAFASISYGRMLSDTLAKDCWYGGNFEFRVELITGAQFSPNVEWLIGATPHLRYNFATGTRWVPFIDGGAGVMATSIGEPDLSSVFEFNLQAGGGLHYFLKDNLALTVEGRYLHVSNGGIKSPNHGINGAIGMVGLTHFF